MKKGLIIFAAAVESVASRKDKTLAVRLGTQETSGEVGGLLFNLQNAVVTVAIKEEDFGADEVEMLESIKADPLDKKQKSKSQRLRDTLHVLWRFAPGNYADFDDFYAAKMEAIIEHFRTKIDEAKP